MDPRLRLDEWCVGALLTTWEAKTAGDVLGSGWKLRDDAPCVIAKGGTSIVGLLTTDAFGAPRTEPRSMGAHENDSTSCK